MKVTVDLDSAFGDSFLEVLMITKQFIEKCCLALEVDPGTLDRDSSPDNVVTWDSMGYLNIIAMIDEELGLAIKGNELEKFETLGDLIDYLTSQGFLE